LKTEEKTEKNQNISKIKDDKKINIVLNNSNNIKINPNKLAHECGIKFKYKNGFCTTNGKEIYSGFCGLHYKNIPKSYFDNIKSLKMEEKKEENQNTSKIKDDKKINIVLNNSNNIKINPNKLAHECGMKFKYKSGYCVSIGKNIYNGFCGLHKPKNTEKTTNNNQEDVLVV
jgi:hypothetical protein